AAGITKLLGTIQPLSVRVERDVATEKLPNQIRRGPAAARLEDAAPVPARRRWIEEPLAAEGAEQVLRDHQRPHVGVVDRRVPLEMAEALLEIRSLHVAE